MANLRSKLSNVYTAVMPPAPPKKTYIHKLYFDERTSRSDFFGCSTLSCHESVMSFVELRPEAEATKSLKGAFKNYVDKTR